MFTNEILFRRLLDEGALYDRQIRLWGLEAQQKCVHCTLSWHITPRLGPTDPSPLAWDSSRHLHVCFPLSIG